MLEIFALATSTKLGRGVLITVGCVVGWFAFLFVHDGKVTAKAVAKIEKQDAAHVQKADAVGARSRDPRTRGVLDKYIRADD